MKKNTLSKGIMIYWIAILCLAGFYSIESFYDYFRGNEEFNYRIILRVFTLIGISYLLVNIFLGLFKKPEYTIPFLLIVTKFSYLTGILGLTAMVMDASGLTQAPDVYPFAGVCVFVALSGYLSSLWFKTRYQNAMQLE
jgi:hypothetical protein